MVGRCGRSSTKQTASWSVAHDDWTRVGPGTVNRGRSLRRSIELKLEAPSTRYHPAEPFLEHFPDLEAEALEILQDLVEHRPDPAWVAEHTEVIEGCRGTPGIPR